MVSAILCALGRCAKTTELPTWLPSLMGFGLITPCVATAQGDADRALLQDLRAALEHAGLSDKAVAHYLQINKGLCSKKLSGERPLQFASLALLPVDVQRWLAVRWVMRHGVPADVIAGARLDRRAQRMARMQLKAQPKAGVA